MKQVTVQAGKAVTVASPSNVSSAIPMAALAVGMVGTVDTLYSKVLNCAK